MMKLKSLNSIVTFAVLLFACISGIALINGCRKTDRIENIPSVNNTEKRFFNEHQSSDPLVQAINKFFVRKNETEHFVEKTVSLIGYPRWDKSMMVKPQPASRGNSEDSVSVVYIPFVRDSQNYVNASLIVKTTETDTLYQFLCDWQYSGYGFDNVEEGWNARNIFHIFSILDRSVFDRKKFRIIDKRLISTDAQNIMDSMGINPDTAEIITEWQESQNVSGRSNVLAPFEICTSWFECIVPCPENKTSGRNTTLMPLCCLVSAYGEVCTTVYIEIPEGNGGGSGGGGGNPPSGGGGGGGGETPPECEGGGTGNRLTNYVNPCGPGWIPVDDEPPSSIELTIDNIKNYKNTSAVIADLEGQVGITSSNFETKVFLDDNSYTVPNSSGGFKIYINKNLSIEKGLLAYAHELSNANNINQIDLLISTAMNNPKTLANKIAFADGMAYVEAKGVYTALLVAYETGNMGLITAPSNIIDVLYNVLSGTITLAEGINIIFTYIQSGDAVDENGNSIYQGYLDYYDSL
ncbi:MAG TPA: hypothetical protein PKC72_09430 [Chitinophagaceae bacterium]|nr:hypothetical protein [Chitinophagaceae bacterium]